MITKPASYSAALNYVFIHIPKCAGSSMHAALRRLHEEQHVTVEERRYHKHAKALEVKDVLGTAWDKAFKFSFVRNPWDLMVSSYFWWLTTASHFPGLAAHAANVKKLGSFEQFLRSEYGRQMINEQHGADLLDWISDGSEVILDFVGRYETLEEDWQRVCEQLGVKPIALGRENPTRHEHYRSYYNEATKRSVAERFKKSIELFGYEF